MGSSYRIVLRSGPTPGKIFPLEKPEMFIGRDLSNDVVINDPEISRRHSHLFLQNGGYSVEDMGSTNGTSVNGQRLVAAQLLRPGDVLTFGERVTIIYELVDPTIDASASSAFPAQDQNLQPAETIPPHMVPPGYPPNAINVPPSQSPGAYYPPLQVPQQRPTVVPGPQQYVPVQPLPLQTPSQQIVYPQPPPPNYEPASSFANQIPTTAGMAPDVAKAKTPIWPFIIIGMLLLIILVLVIDDFRLWCPLFGLCS